MESEDKPKMVWTNFPQLVLVSSAFLLLFTAFNTCGNLITKILNDDKLGNLGFLAILVLYVCFSASSFFSTAIVNKIGRSGLSMSIGAAGYAIFIACFILPAFMAKKVHDTGHVPDSGFLSKTPIYICYFISAAACGVGAGIIWTAQGSWVNRAACESNKGFYNSFAWAMFMASNIIGSAIAGAIMSEGIDG